MSDYRFPLTPLLILLLCTCGSAQILAQAPNDDLADAITVDLSSGAFSHVVNRFDEDVATTEIDELICEKELSWWYSLTPAETKDFVIRAEVVDDISPSVSNDVSLGVYTGSSHPLTEVSCLDNNEGVGRGEAEIVTLTGGVTYYLRIAVPENVFGGDITTTITPAIFTWTGAENNAWEEVDNWDLEALPTTNATVVIPDANPSPRINDTVQIGALRIEAGRLTVTPNGQLTVFGLNEGVAITDNGQLTVEGNLVVSSPSGPSIELNDGQVSLRDNSFSILLGTLRILQGEVNVMGTLAVTTDAGNGVEINNGQLECTPDGLISINEVPGDGVRLGANGRLNVDGEVKITEIGSDGLVLGAGSNVEVNREAELEVSEIGNIGVHFTDNATTFSNQGTLILADAANALSSGGTIENIDESILIAEGTLTSTVNFEGIITLQPGPAEGCLTFTEAVDLTEDVLRFDLEGSTACSLHDQIIFQEAADITDAELVLSGTYLPVAGDTFVIINNVHSNPITGTFAGLGECDTFRHKGALMLISYVGGDGDDIVLYGEPYDAPPVNDDLANATVLEGNDVFSSLPATVGFNGATTETNENNCGATVSWWYAYTPPATADFYIDANGYVDEPRPGVENDLTLGIYTGASHPLTEMRCIDNDEGFEAGGEIDTVTLQAGITYYFRIGAKPKTPLDEIGLAIRQLPVHWTGAVNSDWYEAGNWSSGAVPGTNDLVEIDPAPNSAVISTGNVNLVSLSINAGGLFSLAQGASLRLSGGEIGLNVQGEVTVNGILTVENQRQRSVSCRGVMSVGGTGVLLAYGSHFGVGGTLNCAGIVELSRGADMAVSTSGTLLIEESGALSITGRVPIGMIAQGRIDILGNLSISGPEFGITYDNGSINIRSTGRVSITNFISRGINFNSTELAIINDGALFVAGSSSISIGGGNLVNSATATLSAKNRLTGDVSFAAGSRLEPGASPGCLTFESPVDLSETTLAFEIEGTTRCTGYDQIEYDDVLNIDDAILELSGSYVPQVGDQFSLLTTSGSNEAGGTFAGLPEGGTVLFNGVPLQIAYEVYEGSKIDVVLTAIDNIDVRWTGAVDSNWYEGGNWSTKLVPGPESHVTIGDIVAPPAVIDTGSVTVAEIQVINTGQFRLNEAATLTISGGTEGLFLDTDSLTVLNGSVSINNQIGDYGLKVHSDVEVGPAGIIFLEEGGINVYRARLSVAGSVTSLTAPAEGILLETGVVYVDTTGSVSISYPTGSGVRTFDGNDTLEVNGRLSILSPGFDGIRAGQGDYLSVPKGLLEVNNAGRHGINSVKAAIGGTLKVIGSSNDAITGSQDFSINAGGTLAVDGFVRTLINFAANSRLAPGSPTGCAFFDREVLFNNAILTIEINGPTVCTDYSQLTYDNFLRINGASLELDGDYVPMAGETFLVAVPDNVSTPSSGTFRGLPNGDTLSFNGTLLEITYPSMAEFGGGGAFITLTTLLGADQAIWTGAVDSDWYNPDNWASGVIPTADDDVLIEAGANPAILPTGTATIASLQLRNGGNFTVAEGAILNLSAGTAGLVAKSGRLIVNGKLLVDQQANGMPLLGVTTTIGPNGNLMFQQTNTDVLVTRTLTCNGQLQLNDGPGLSLQGDGRLNVGSTGDCRINAATGTGLLHNGAGVSINGKLTVTNSGGDGIHATNDNGMAFNAPSEVTLRNNGGHGIHCDDDGSYPINVRGVLTISGSALNAVDEGIFLPRTGCTLRCAGTIDTRWQDEDNYRMEVGDSNGCLNVLAIPDLGEGTLAFTINGTTPCTGYSQLNIPQGINIDGAVLELNGSYIPEIGEAFSLILKPGSGAFTQRFAGLPEGTLFPFNGVLLKISYADGTNDNDVVLTATQNAIEASWTGAVNSNWYEAGNWTIGRVPSTTDRVIIGDISDAPIAIIDTGAVTITELHVVGSDGQFRLNEGADLTISGGADGLVLTGDSLIILDGNVLITDQSGNYGLTAKSDLTIGQSGSLTLNQLGVEMGGFHNLIVDGTVNCTNAPADAVVIDDGILEISPTGSWTIEAPVGAGIRVTNDPSEIMVDGSLSVIGAGEDGIIGDREMLTIGTTGTLIIRDAAFNGIESINGNINGKLIITNSGGNAIFLDNEDFQFFNGSTLGAEGSISGEVGFFDGSNLQPGSSPGCLTMRSSVSNLPILTIELEGITACTEYDQIVLRASGQLGGASLRLEGDYQPTVNDVFTIVRNDADSDIVGTFAGLPEGALIEFNNSFLEISYNNGRDITLTTVSVLPLDLLSFTGKARNKNNLLSWTTANEEDFSHFEVQRSADGNTWQLLGAVAGAAEGRNAGQYDYVDDKPQSSAYYRLRMVDLDGSYAFSPIVYLEREVTAELRVFPNPNSGSFDLRLPEVSEPLSLALYSAHSTRVSAKKIGAGTRRWSSREALPPGIYLVVVSTQDGRRWTERMVVQ
ncbi:T9SS type A sorting domain-containing protein [Lewinella sp. 4G2]|uniref:T9SS type A sorting domain-containing protein n=1 Tax=Lewinella sp. 4G2 TaxID=1803372 RepID=UPI0007B49751|nr:T9SS type A sorting domain-containing protein [Lewinella sp. 4G2]OAV44057.1 hypothetical protein A3850_005900 [Lewinella sp. 4G2]